MFAATLLYPRPAMKASPAKNDDAEPPAGRSTGRAAKFQYATGDTPLAGYTIKRGIGRGGFGEVYFATSDAGKEVALKLIRRNLDIELRGVRQCLNLKHPNLVSLFDLRSDDADDQWVVMEYVAGESLEDAIQRHPDGMPIELAIDWLRGIAAGVAYLHSSGIVHRDLKPGNIYLERGAGAVEPRVRIGDYGLSKFISASRRSGQTESVGTVHYMAPEIAGGRYGREIDTYALGVVLYEMLTGHVPFEGESVGEVLMKHLTAEPELTRVEEPYRSIVAGALAKDPELRISSVEQMLAMLPSDESHAEPVIAAPITPTYGEVWSPVSRPPHTHHPVPPREPLWQGLVELTDNLRSGWKSWNLPPLGKGLVLFGAVAGLLVTSWAWLPTAAGILMLYGLYYVVWAGFLQGTGVTPTSPAVTPVARAAKPTKRRKSTYNWRAAAARERRERTPRQKATTLTGAMLGSAVVAILVGLIAAPLLTNGTATDTAAFAAWFTVVATLGAWGVLASGTALDFDAEDWLPRRGINLGAGLAVGVLAFHLASFLGNGLPYTDGWGFNRGEVLLEEAIDVDLYQGVSFDNNTVTPPLVGSMAFFGGVFLLVRWWKSTDFVRRNRVGLWSVAMAGLGAWLVSFVTWYPQPTGLVLAGTIALATQVSSPWCPPRRRRELARGPAGGIYDV